MTDTTQKNEKPKEVAAASPPKVEPVEKAPSPPAPAVEAPPVLAPAVEESRWYRVHFLRHQKGSGKVITRIGAGMARFKASQTDEKAEDFPTKILKLTPAQAAEFEKNPAFDIRNSVAPEPKGLGKKQVSRTIAPVTSTEGETKKEEGGS